MKGLLLLALLAAASASDVIDDVPAAEENDNVVEVVELEEIQKILGLDLGESVKILTETDEDGDDAYGTLLFDSMLMDPSEAQFDDCEKPELAEKCPADKCLETIGQC